jgi:hypothetical protein
MAQAMEVTIPTASQLTFVFDFIFAKLSGGNLVAKSIIATILLQKTVKCTANFVRKYFQQ